MDARVFRSKDGDDSADSSTVCQGIGELSGIGGHRSGSPVGQFGLLGKAKSAFLTNDDQTTGGCVAARLDDETACRWNAEAPEFLRSYCQ